MDLVIKRNSEDVNWDHVKQQVHAGFQGVWKEEPPEEKKPFWIREETLP